VVSWSPGLPFKLGDTGSILDRTSTQGLKIIEEKVLLYIDISKWLDFRVFPDKDVKIVGTSDPLSISHSEVDEWTGDKC
jgi:hypothetical protein